MAKVLKRLGKATLSTSSSTLYTVPNGKTAYVAYVSVMNTTSSAVTATINIAGTTWLACSIPANSQFSDGQVKISLLTGETITAQASANSALQIFINGMEE